MTTPCEVGIYCRNSTTVAGEQLAKCALCRLSPGNENHLDMAHYWQPTKEARETGNHKHPILVEKRRITRILKRAAELGKKRARDMKKRRISRLAKQAEKTTEKQIIRATKNSGRQNKDGDHISLGIITLDTKLQTENYNPTIRLSELTKVREDAKRAGTWMGGLVIRNAKDVGCVVLAEEDFAKLLGWIRREYERQMGLEISGDGKTGIDMVEGSEH